MKKVLYRETPCQTHFKNGNYYWHTNIKTYKGLIDNFFKDLSLP